MHDTWLFSGDFVASKLVHWEEDLRQGSNQVRNQVLRQQGNFWFVKGSEQPSSFDASWATGSVFFQKITERYGYMVDIQTNKQSVTMQSLDLRHLLEEFQCNLALIAPLACRDGGIKTLLQVCHEKGETFSLGHCLLAGGPDLTVLV